MFIFIILLKFKCYDSYVCIIFLFYWDIVNYIKLNEVNVDKKIILMWIFDKGEI